MKAMVLRSHAPVSERPLRLEEADVPGISGHEVLVKVSACGVCHTDVHIAEGEVFKDVKLPLIMGHEAVGTVVKLGDRATYVKEGDRVGIGWTYNSCLNCKRCDSGRENICAKRESVGCGRDGGYADFARLDSRFVTKIPDGLKFNETAPLFCAGLTAFRAAKRADVKGGERVAVVGIGGLGSYAVQFAKLRGAEVVAFSRNDDHLRLAESLGADETVKSGSDLMQDVKSADIDAAMVFAPSAEVLENVMLGSPRGARVVMAGNIERMNPMDYRRAMSGEKSLTTVSVGTREDMRELLELAAEGHVSSKVDTMRLEQANDALIKLKSGNFVGRTVLTM